MSHHKFDPLSGSSRFQGKMRHYHHSNRVHDHANWDEWIGDKIKSPARLKMEKVLLTVGTLIVGLVLIAGVIFVVAVLMGKILPMASK